jgi:hypothetical protein
MIRIYWFYCSQKKTDESRFYLKSKTELDLLDFSFLIFNMLAYNWVVLFHNKLVRGILFVFVGCIEMTSASARNQFN